MLNRNVFSTRESQLRAKQKLDEERRRRELNSQQEQKVRNETNGIIRICEIEAYKRKTSAKCEPSWMKCQQLLSEEHGLKIETRGTNPAPTLPEILNERIDAGYALAAQVAGVIAESVPAKLTTGTAERKAATLIQQLAIMRRQMRSLSQRVLDMVDPEFLRDCAARIDDYLSEFDVEEIANDHARRLRSLPKPYDVVDWSSATGQKITVKKLDWLATKSAEFFRSLESQIEISAKKRKAANCVQVVRIENVVTIEKQAINIPKYIELDWLFDLINRVDGYGYEWYPEDESNNETVNLYW